MNWKEMHIGIDLGLQELNSNLFGKIQHQAKDYYLNRLVVDFILGEGKDSTGNNQIPVLTADELRNRYVFLEPYIKNLKLDLVRGDKFDYGIIPKGFTDDIYSGLLHDGVEYLVVEPGNPVMSLTGFGGAAVPSKNSRFTVNISNALPKTDDFVIYFYQLSIGGKYKIVNAGDYDFTLIGAENNMVGTEFVVTAYEMLIGVNTAILKPLAIEPNWATSGAVLRALTNLDMLMFYSSLSNVDVGYTFGEGKLIQGVTYRVVTGGTITGFAAYCGFDTFEGNFVFTCKKTGVPTWASSGVTLTETREFPNRLVDYKELESALDHSFGSSKDSPICCLIDGKFRVYHEGKFRVNYVILDYIRTPRKIDSIGNVDTDLNIALHGLLVDRVIQRITGHRGQPQYQTIRHENEEIK